MRILIVVPGLTNGGGEMVAYRLAKNVSTTHSVCIYNLAFINIGKKLSGNQISENKNLGIISFENKLNYFLHRFFLLFPTDKLIVGVNFLLNRWRKKDLLRTIKEFKPDVVNTHLVSSDYLYAGISDKKLPWIVSMHGSYEYDLKRNIGKKQKVLELCDAVVCCADKNYAILNEFSDSIRKIIEPKFSKIYHGMENSKNDPMKKSQLGIAADSTVFVMVARPQLTKGWIEALNAFEKLNHPKAYFIAVSEGEEITVLKEKYQDNKNIIFYGYHSSPMDLVKMCDVGLLPTHFKSESLPNTVIEYLICGKPVIATDFAEIPLMIDHEGCKAGILVPLKEGKANVESLANAMQTYVQDKQKLEHDSHLAFLASQKFDLETFNKSYISVFQNTITKKNDSL